MSVAPVPSLFPVLFSAVRVLLDHDGSVRAGYVAYCLLLGVFPFLIFLAHLSGFLIGPDQARVVLDNLMSFVPDYLRPTLRPTVEAVLTGGDIGVMSLALLASVWLPSSAVDAIRGGFARAYPDCRLRSWFLGRIVSVSCVLIGVVVAILLSALLVLGPVLFRLLEETLQLQLPWGLVVFRNFIGFSVFVGYLWFLHRVLPNRLHFRGRHIWPGVAFGALLWTAVALGLGQYLDHTRHYETVYGALAGVAISLVFFYFSSLVILLSAEINGVLDARHAARSGIAAISAAHDDG